MYEVENTMCPQGILEIIAEAGTERTTISALYKVRTIRTNWPCLFQFSLFQSFYLHPRTAARFSIYTLSSATSPVRNLPTRRGMRRLKFKSTVAKVLTCCYAGRNSHITNSSIRSLKWLSYNCSKSTSQVWLSTVTYNETQCLGTHRSGQKSGELSKQLVLII